MPTVTPNVQRFWPFFKVYVAINPMNGHGDPAQHHNPAI
jgi:hypothetical protein